MKKFIYPIIAIFIIILWIAIYKFNFTNNDIYVEYNGEMMKQDDYKSLEEHCKMMPEMKWCEWFDFAIVANTGGHTMDHAWMITDEISFLSEMIPHHQEAIDTSSSLLIQTQNTWLKLILVNIMSWQANEIKIMKERLSNNYTWSNYKAMYMPMMRDTKNINDVKILEKMYMEDMITHHQWAVDMANKLLTIMREQDPLIKLNETWMRQRELLKSFAQNIIDAQTKEISEFQELLKNY